MDDKFGAMMNRAFWVTERICQGNFVDAKKATYLQRFGITHIVNVCNVPNQVRGEDFGFLEMAWIPTKDHVLFPEEKAIEMVQVLNRMVVEESRKVYVHCVAGQNRSATALWLFLIAQGIEDEVARSMIEDQNIDAVAGYRRLVNDSLIKTVKEYGARHFSASNDHIGLRALKE
ncbi:MAG: dual specificity protein phosphatase [Planctomycetota bacterium]|nr:dual specificity protein phosphatase [Planctomycetota bacterium]